MSKKRDSKKWKILVTTKVAGELLDTMPAQFFDAAEFTATHGRLDDSQMLIELLSDKDAVVLDLEPITSAILTMCPNLKVISRFGEGYDAIDLESAKRLNVRVTRTRAVSSQAVARHTLSLILALTHHVAENDRTIKLGKWIRKPNLSDGNLTLGIVGLGKIGTAVADLARGFGFGIVAYDIVRRSTEYKYISSMDELISVSDIITIHLPLNKETRNFISVDSIKKLKGKYLINAARGGIVDEKALLGSLADGEIKGYAADVFLNEPVSGISEKLALHPNVICSPHLAALDEVTNNQVTERSIRNALYCLNEEHEKVISYVV